VENETALMKIKSDRYLTIKKLTEAVGGGLTPRMVRHYHQIGLLPEAVRSPSNYRLYTQTHVQQLRQIISLKQQGFQLEHIRKLLAKPDVGVSPIAQLQQQYTLFIQRFDCAQRTANNSTATNSISIRRVVRAGYFLSNYPGRGDVGEAGANILFDSIDAPAPPQGRGQRSHLNKK